MEDIFHYPNVPSLSHFLSVLKFPRWLNVCNCLILQFVALTVHLGNDHPFCLLRIDDLSFLSTLPPPESSCCFLLYNYYSAIFNIYIDLRICEKGFETGEEKQEKIKKKISLINREGKDECEKNNETNMKK